MRLPKKIIAVDLETTDADASIGDIAQIGAIVVNEDLSLGEAFSSYVRPLSNHRNPKAMEVNQISEERLMNAPSPSVILNKFADFCIRNTGDKRPMLAAWGAYFDIAFLRETYKKINEDYPFSYRCIDLKTIAIWDMGRIRNNTLSGGVHHFLEALGMKFEGTAHDALDDIRNTMRIIQRLSEL